MDYQQRAIEYAHLHQDHNRGNPSPVEQPRLVDKQYLMILKCRDRLKAIGDIEWQNIELMLGQLDYVDTPERQRKNELLVKGIEVFTRMAEEHANRIVDRG